MLCKQCHHEVPTPPPLREDFEFAVLYGDAKTAWDKARLTQTREWGYCECLRCGVCWDALVANRKCHCPEPSPLPPAPPPAPPQREAGVSDGLPDDPHRVP